MEAFLVSTGVVALAELGDKTQLLAFMLAARFRRPLPIVMGILVATIANHAVAGALGAWVSALLGPDLMRWVLGLSFLAMAVWIMVPDQLEESESQVVPRGVFVATVIAFFFAEMGDKTQIATVALGAQFHNVVMVAAGTTLGMMLANVPAVYLGEAATRIVPLKYVRIGAALIFLGIGLWGIASLLGLFK